MRCRQLALLAIVSIAILGCSRFTNRSCAREEVTLVAQAEGRTSQLTVNQSGMELVRVEPDGTAIIRCISGQKTAGEQFRAKPGQIIVLEQKSDSGRQITLLSSDPATQQATIRAEVWKKTRAVWF